MLLKKIMCTRVANIRCYISIFLTVETGYCSQGVPKYNCLVPMEGTQSH